MKLRIKAKLICMITLSIATGMTWSMESNIGMGFVLGNPSGLSVKISPSEMNSFNLVIGYDLYRRDESVYLSGDYVWYNYNVISVSKGKMPIYYGPGIRTALSQNSSLGVRGVLGVEYQFADAPFDAFLEVGPGINIVPNTHPDVSVGLGARYFF